MITTVNQITNFPITCERGNSSQIRLPQKVADSYHVLQSLIFMMLGHMGEAHRDGLPVQLSLIHISEPTRPLYISYAVFCLKKQRPAPPPRALRASPPVFFLMIRRPPRSTHCISSAASDVYKRQGR